MQKRSPYWQASNPKHGFIDLHLHTIHSDGESSPQQLLTRAAEKKLRAIAITDHDTLSGVEETMGIAEKFGIQCIPGVEISAYTEEDGEIHILGYCVDPENSYLLDTLQHLKTVRRERILHMLDRLHSLGIDIPFEAVLETAKHSSVIGRPHLARAMVALGFASSVDNAFYRYIATGKPAFVLKKGLTYEHAIRAIVKAGGIPVYAHPGVNKKDYLIPKLVKLGLRGLEVFHSGHSYSAIQRYSRLVMRHNLVATGGSDCHGGSKTRPPLIGTVTVPYIILEYLLEARNAVSI